MIVYVNHYIFGCKMVYFLINDWFLDVYEHKLRIVYL